MNNLAFKLIQNYKNNPDKICLVQDGSQITYKDLYDKVKEFKKYLLSKEIKKESKVLVLVPMSINLYVTLISLWTIGAVPCFMDAGFIKNGMKKNEFANVDGLIGITKYLLYSNINSNLKKLDIKINANVIDKLGISDGELSIEEVEGDSDAIITYTSGTTGKPKIAARSHEFLLAQANILENCLDYAGEDIELSTVPIFTLSNISSQITTVIADANFSDLGSSKAKKIVKQIENNKINRIMAAPGLLNVIINYCRANSIVLGNVRKVFTGGGAVFVDFVNELKTVFPNSKIVTLYGSTEAEPIAEQDVTNLDEEDLEKTMRGNGILAGKIVGVSDCKVISSKEKTIGPLTTEEFINMQTEDVGEIVVTGENVLKGYVGGYGDKENKFSVDGTIYHRTGDLGIIDETGRLWLRGRVKNPYFDIEAALHARFKLGKIAVVEKDEKLILVLEEGAFDKTKIDVLINAIRFRKIDDIKFIKKIPVDKRHSTKVDYNTLMKMI